MSEGISVSASIATETTTGVDGGLDVSVTVEIDGVEHDGEVTLVRNHEGRWSSWGAMDHWVSSDLLAVIRDRDDCREILDEVEAAAAASCAEAS